MPIWKLVQFFSKIGNSYRGTFKPEVFVLSDTTNPEQTACKISTLILS